MLRMVVTAGLSILLGGCGLFGPSHQGGISTSIAPEDYAERLCGYLELEDYPACLTQVLDYFERPRSNRVPAEQSTSGPFAVMLDGDVYLGDYRTDSPFAASFRVASQRKACRGSYNAFTGSVDAVFDVYCDDGRSGWADIILASDGRNGIGKLMLDDGTRGDIVFGYTALGRAEPYPYQP